MYVVCVTVWVKPEFVEDFVRASLDNARHTREEAGNVRFDFSRAEEGAARFFLYEVYLTKEDFAKRHGGSIPAGPGGSHWTFVIGELMSLALGIATFLGTSS